MRKASKCHFWIKENNLTSNSVPWMKFYKYKYYKLCNPPMYCIGKEDNNSLSRCFCVALTVISKESDGINTQYTDTDHITEFVSGIVQLIIHRNSGEKIIPSGGVSANYFIESFH